MMYIEMLSEVRPAKKHEVKPVDVPVLSPTAPSEALSRDQRANVKNQIKKLPKDSAIKLSA